MTLYGIETTIWRELLVPARYSFWDLHVAIQDAMGWLDYHLHEFHIRLDGGEDSVVFGIPSDDDDWDLGYSVLPGWQHDVIDFVSQPGDVIRYDYDFGDDWSHSVELLKVEGREPGVKYPRCTGGERACPPEDCGGVSGYEELLRALFDPTDPEHEPMKEWIPKGWGQRYSIQMQLFSMIPKNAGRSHLAKNEEEFVDLHRIVPRVLH